MKLLTFRTVEGLRLGIKTDKGILDVSQALTLFPTSDIPQTIDEVLQAEDNSIYLLQQFVRKMEQSNNSEIFLKEDSLNLGPCVPNPGKVIGVGLNYYGYLEKVNMSKPDFPHLFNKFSSAVRASGDPILIPSNSTEVDYEAELVIVIGKKARHVSKEEALDYVIGYCNTNDFSARDLQYMTTSWVPGKCCDSFCPIGPYLVTSDEVGDPNNLTLKAYVNGEIRQNANTNDMIFNCAELVSSLSELFTLEPGDIILTGTPDGIVMTYPEEEREWLKEGDEIVVEIEKLGRLFNVMKQEEPQR